MTSIDYHLNELKIALDASDKRRVLPSLRDGDEAILDIGCGIGQSFVALNCLDRVCVGVDVDLDALRYGAATYGEAIRFILCDAARIPMPSGYFDLVLSRVSLPYTNVPQVVEEIKRTLKPGSGRVWLTLHVRATAMAYLKAAVRPRLNLKRLTHVLYILVNGYALKYCGFVFPFVGGRYESWQDPEAMKTLLQRHGFVDVQAYTANGHSIVEARRA